MQEQVPMDEQVNGSPKPLLEYKFLNTAKAKEKHSYQNLGGLCPYPGRPIKVDTSDATFPHNVEDAV